MPEVVSDTPISARARRVLTYEHDQLVYALADQFDMSILRAYDVFHEMKLYLLLCALNAGEKLAVPPEIDAMLHLFLEDPAFNDFCRQDICGTIEHIPCKTLGARDTEHVLDRAHERYTKHFDQRLWRRGLPACTCSFTPH